MTLSRIRTEAPNRVLLAAKTSSGASLAVQFDSLSSSGSAEVSVSCAHRPAAELGAEVVRTAVEQARAWRWTTILARANEQDAWSRRVLELAGFEAVGAALGMTVMISQEVEACVHTS